jgi:hypothetical protein
MSVLPAGANLASYFIVLIVIAILTLVAAIILQKNSSINAEIDVERSPSTTPAFTLSERTRSLLKFGVYLRAKSWKLSLHAASSVRKSLRDVDRDAHKVTSNTFILLFVVPVLFILYGTLSAIKGTKFLLWDFPWNELGYTSNLLFRPTASIFYPPRFLVDKFIIDLFRFMLLPIWLVLVLFRGFFMLLALLACACFDLLRKCVA